MPAITKAQAKEALQHILDNIIEDTEDDGSLGPIGKTFQKAKINGILRLNGLTSDAIDALQYSDPDNPTSFLDLEKGEQGLVKTFRAFVYFRDASEEPLDSHEKWMAISLEDFQEF